MPKSEMNMLIIKELKKIHLELIAFVKTKKDVPEIELYISYAEESLLYILNIKKVAIGEFSLT